MFVGTVIDFFFFFGEKCILFIDLFVHFNFYIVYFFSYLLVFNDHQWGKMVFGVYVICCNGHIYQQGLIDPC